MCNKHKKYKAIHKPRVDCWGCWQMWMEDHPDDDVKVSEVYSVLNSMAQYAATGEY